MTSKNQNTTFTLPHDPLTPLDPKQQPTPFAMQRFRAEIYANCRAVTGIVHGGHYGHLGMAMPPAEYSALAHVGAGGAYDLPVRPPRIDFTGMSVIQREDAKATFAEEMDDYNDSWSLQHQLKKLMLDAIPEVYINRLKDRQHNFAEVTVRTILDHMMTRYGTIRPEDLEANLKRMDQPWDPDTNIQSVFDNAAECRAFAAEGQDAISDPTYIRRVLEVFRKSGVFSNDIRDWNLKPEADKTIAELKVHFLRADQQRRANEPTLKHTLAAKASGTVSDTVAEKTQPTTSNGPIRHYCWSHGLGLNPDHTSATCTNPAPGHIRDATLANMKGGNNTIRRQAGERAVYAPPKRKANKATKAATEKTDE
jgi:hypothetical protein